MRESRRQVFAVISRELDYQRKWRHLDEINSVGDFLVHIQQHLNRAICVYGTQHPEPLLHELRRVAAVCVACMERHGAPEREGLDGAPDWMWP